MVGLSFSYHSFFVANFLPRKHSREVLELEEMSVYFISKLHTPELRPYTNTFFHTWNSIQRLESSQVDWTPERNEWTMFILF